MVALLDVSVVASSGIAAGVLYWQNKRPESSSTGESETQPWSEILRDPSKCLTVWNEKFSPSFCTITELFPFLLICLAAGSPFSVLWAAIQVNTGDLDLVGDFQMLRDGKTDGLSWERLGGKQPSLSEAPDWLGPDVGFLGRVFVYLSITLWRAGKLQELLQRLIRYKNETTWAKFGREWDSIIWGITRRAAVVILGSCGCLPWLQYTYPVILLDDFSYQAQARILSAEIPNPSNSQEKLQIPMTVSMVIVPLFDLARGIHLFFKIFLLGVTAYPFYTDAIEINAFLACSALAWTYFLWTKLWADWAAVWETAQGLRAAGGAG